MWLGSCLLRVSVHAQQLGDAADPHSIGLGDVHQIGRVQVAQLLHVLDDFNRSGLRSSGANERRAHEAQSLPTGRAPPTTLLLELRNATPLPFA